MREILFRGKTVSENEYFDDGEWIEGFYTCFNGKEHRIYTGYAETDCGDYYPDWFSVVPETVTQFTGLIDKNGKKIFEGDIVRLFLVDDKEIGIIKFNDIKCRFMYYDGEGYYSFDNTCEFEVIGNIHDNSELLNN